MDQLLLDIYSSINEPDGIYAVTMGQSLISQLKLYEHEGSWDKALTGYDLLCRHTAPAYLASEAMPATTASNPASYGQQGLLTSLQQLGCRHLIEAYWQGQPKLVSAGHFSALCVCDAAFVSSCSVTYVALFCCMQRCRQQACLVEKGVWWLGSMSLLHGYAGDSQSLDMRYESAWRMGQWTTLLDQEGANPGQPVSTDQAIQGCLKVCSPHALKRRSPKALCYSSKCHCHDVTSNVCKQVKWMVDIPGGQQRLLTYVLQALSDGDQRQCKALLLDARGGIVKSLGHVSTESVSSVVPAILQLQQLQCLQEAWEFRWPNMSLCRPGSPGVSCSLCF